MLIYSLIHYNNDYNNNSHAPRTLLTVVFFSIFYCVFSYLLFINKTITIITLIYNNNY